MTIIGKCFACKKRRLFVRRRKLVIPDAVTGTKAEARSRESFCGQCFTKVKRHMYDHQTNQA